MKKLTKLLVCTLCASFTNATLATSVHDPHNSFLLKRLPSQNELDDPFDQSAVNQERAYFEKVVTEPYGIPENEVTKFKLEDWKRENGFDEAVPLVNIDGSRSSLLEVFDLDWDTSRAGDVPNGYRLDPAMRTGLSSLTVDYFNSGDLGLGRRMTCVKQTTDILDTKLPTDTMRKLAERGKGAMACYVSNYGAIGGSVRDNFKSFPEGEEAENGDPQAFATVAMEFWPGEPENKVRFFVFAASNGPGVNDDELFYFEGGDDSKFTSVKLDNGDGHSQPGICMSCHGGLFNQNSEGVVDNAHFLPFDKGAFRFADENGDSAVADLEDIQEEADKRFAILNLWILDAERRAYGLDSDIPKYLRGAHDFNFRGGFFEPPILTDNSHIDDSILIEEIFSGNKEHIQNEEYVDSIFVNSDEDTEIYKDVFAPYCRGCHLAIKPFEASGGDVTLDAQFTKGFLCNLGSMPHAEVNMRNMLNAANTLNRLVDSSCVGLPSLIDFESEEISEENTYYHEHLSDGPFAPPTIGVTSTAPLLRANTIKRSAQTPLIEGGFSISTFTLAHEADAAQENVADMNGAKLKKLAFQYLISDSDFIYVDFKQGNTTRMALRILDQTISVELNQDGDNSQLPNDHSRVQFTHIQDELFRTADLTDLIPDGTTHAIVYLADADGNSPVEIDDILVDFDSDYRLAYAPNTADISFSPLNNGIAGETKTCPEGTSFSKLAEITNARRPVRGRLTPVIGLNTGDSCLGEFNDIRISLIPSQLGVTDLTDHDIVVAFDYHVDPDTVFLGQYNGNGADSVLLPITSNSSRMGVQEKIDTETRIGRHSFVVDTENLTSSNLFLRWQSVPFSLENSGFHINNIKVYVRDKS